MNALIRFLVRLGLLKEDLDYHLLRASMVLIFLMFGYSKWFEYEAQMLIPGIRYSRSWLVSWYLRMAIWRALVSGVLG
jgi:uncharacterized membrane protein YkgB